MILGSEVYLHQTSVKGFEYDRRILIQISKI